MNIAELEHDLSQSAFLKPGQLLWSESRSYNDPNSSPTVDAQLFAFQPQLYARPQPSEMLTSSPHYYFSLAAENEMEIEGDCAHDRSDRCTRAYCITAIGTKIGKVVLSEFQITTH